MSWPDDHRPRFVVGACRFAGSRFPLTVSVDYYVYDRAYAFRIVRRYPAGGHAGVPYSARSRKRLAEAACAELNARHAQPLDEALLVLAKPG